MFKLLRLTLILSPLVGFLNGESLVTDTPENDVTTIPREFHATETNQTPDNKVERTLILIKPDAVQRKLIGKIIDRFENRGLTLIALKFVIGTQRVLDEHYIQHKGKPYHDDLMKFMVSGPVVPMVWEGPNAIQIARNMIGYFKPELAVSGTIRGDFSLDMRRNVIHGSDSVKTANNEINIWFHPNEIISSTQIDKNL